MNKEIYHIYRNILTNTIRLLGDGYCVYPPYELGMDLIPKGYILRDYATPRKPNDPEVYRPI